MTEADIYEILDFVGMYMQQKWKKVSEKTKIKVNGIAKHIFQNQTN